MHKLILSALIFFALFASGCTNLSVKKPEGFAEVKSKKHYRAVSPEGMFYKVRTVKNYPEQDLEFWGRALSNHLIKEGYFSIGSGEPFEAGNREGILYEWGMPYGNEDYIYLTAIIIFGKTIAIVEAAGEHTVYMQYRDSMLESIENISIR